MKHIELNGINFEVHNSKRENIANLRRYAGRTLTDCYSRPSYSKSYIYKMWLEWAVNAGIEYFGVSGYNCNFFSLQGLAEHEGKTYILRITKSKNCAFIVE